MYKSFTLSVDVRSFQAGRHLPLGVAAVYCQAWLPTPLQGAGSMFYCVYTAATDAGDVLMLLQAE